MPVGGDLLTGEGRAGTEMPLLKGQKVGNIFLFLSEEASRLQLT